MTMANDPYWGKVVSLIHADDAVDTNSSALRARMTCMHADVAEVGSFARGSALPQFYSNLLGKPGYYFGNPTNSGDWLAIVSGSSDICGGDFTTEGWIYFPSEVPRSQTRGIVGARKPGNYVNEMVLYYSSYNAAPRVDFTATVGGTSVNWAWMTPEYNRWIHWAVVRQGATGFFFFDGVLRGSWGAGGSRDVLTNEIRISANSGVVAYGHTGGISDVRHYFNVSKYTANFTPPPFPGPYPHPFRDSCKYRALSSIGSAIQPYTPDSKFGGGCMRFDGASHVTGAASDDWNFGTGDFTIECFVKRETGGSTYKVIFGIWTNTLDRWWALALSDTNVLQFWAGDNGSTETGLSSGQVPALNTWVHVAVSRQGANLYLFIDGTLAATRSDVGAQIFGNSASALYFGRRSGSTGDYFAGMVDEVRITKGAARYTGNFTPPTQPHPEGITVVSGTVRDHTGALCSRLVRVHDRVSGRVVGEAMSDPTTGAFSIGAAEPLVYAVVLDSTGGYNSLILDRLEPQL